ncbi:MAG TPA: hypothetical protein VGE77_07455 [Nocardioides sp.]
MRRSRPVLLSVAGPLTALLLASCTSHGGADPDDASTWEEQLRAGAAAVTADRTALAAELEPLADGGLAGATMEDVRAGAAYGATDLPDWAFGRDCETVNGATSGAPEEGRTFHVAAAGVCADVVDRRRVEDLRSAEEISLNVLADLETVPTDDVPDADAWDTLLGALEDRADAQAMRLAAVEGGDADEIGEVYAGTRPDVVALPWVELGLDQRDCRSITW